jgi:hypothetical protein
VSALDRLAQRVAAIEAAFAARAPIEPAIVWRCRGDHVSAADRRAAAEHAGHIGKPDARIIYTLCCDASRPDRAVLEEIETPVDDRLDALRARLRNLPPDRARNAITEMHTLGRVDADEARTLRAELSARKSAA